jgi:hypothetical protein
MSSGSELAHPPPDIPTFTRRQALWHITTAAMSLAAAVPAVAQAPQPSALVLAEAAQAFLMALAAEKRQRAVFPFDSAARLDWHYIPRRRQGLPIKDMSAEERAAAYRLLGTALSESGYRKVVGIMRLEEVLRQSAFFPFSRDPENYAFLVFGAPGGGRPWGWRVEGHHLSLHFTIVDDARVAVTPAFLGANPAEVREGAHKGLRVLAQEQDLAFDLVRHLGPGQRQQALIAARSLGDIVSGPGRSDSLKSPVGLPWAAMTPPQRDKALRLLAEYVHNLRQELAAVALRQVQEAGVDTLHFAWAGGLEPGQAHYYRLHGPTLLIEYDNTQNDANHIHTVWHDLRNDFGIDALRTHYRSGHRHHG